MYILVAEDDPDVRLTMGMMLELHGHRVEVAANGLEAVERATEHPPDVVLMDIGMPIMDGLAATRSLRERPGTVAVPVVCISAYLTQEDWCAKAYEAGCIACMAKPVKWEALNALLATLHGPPDGQRE